MESHYNTYELSMGTFTMVSEDGSITEIERGSFCPEPPSKKCIKESTPLLETAARQLEEYFQGKRTEFSLPLSPKGSAFQQKVWNALCTIPYGETRSYKQIAEQIGSPKACRAVGMANNRNPIMIVIPCHRVIGTNGSLTGYAGGMEMKEKLLALEQNA